MTYALVTNGEGHSTDGNGFTSGAFNTTGANLIVLGLCAADVAIGTISDSKGNTWAPLTKYVDAFTDRWFQFFYCEAPTVGSGHTFSVSGTGTHPSITMSAWSGGTTSSFDVESGAANGFATSVQPGSVTPSAANELIITGFQTDDSVTPSVDSGFTITDAPIQTGFGWSGQTMAYLIETTATAKNPTWSTPNNTRNIAAIAAFKAAAAGAPFLARPMPPLYQAVKRVSYY